MYVPFAVGAVRAALAEPERVARCVPGLQPDASEAEAGDGVSLRGRLRVRIGGSSITYRGGLRLTHEMRGADGGSGDERYTVGGEGAEARGDGSVELTLTAVPRPAGDGEGTVLACTAELRGTGRITEFEEKQRESAGRRLLDRFGSELAASMADDPVSPVDAPGPAAGTGGIGEPDDNEPVIPGIPAPETPGSADARERDAERAGAAEEPEEPETRNEPDERENPEEPGEGARSGSVFDVEVPPSSLDPESDAAFDGGPGGGFGDDLAGRDAGDGGDEGFEGDFGGFGGPDDFGGFGDGLGEGPSPAEAEAAHARRTMIGRSAEEVDHAPPRGRYAPVPPPESASSALAVLRWAAPAALVLVSAVVIGRMLRRRR
ncbi:hypothetical protein GCM10010420_38690 [Streptomyces glaucosporus]|uniref:Carbon monoxide dehydrogenase subunit G n=1 Tax=Streptomyces glaucosporus TaxID=284044 RepID=A0ABP5VNE8_9ACTN